MDTRGTLLTAGVGVALIAGVAGVVVMSGVGSTDDAPDAPAGTDATVEAVEPRPDPTPRGPAADGDRPNVLIILWDTVRADRMSLYGHDRPTTPRLEGFAERAVVYDNATAPAMWTLPTHASMFTGKWAESHGARASHSLRWLDACQDTLAETLDGAGYDTFFFSSNLIASPMTNLHQGFDEVLTTYTRKGVPRGPHNKAARKATTSKLVDRDRSTEISPAFEGSDQEKWGKAVFKDAAPVLHKGLVRWLDGRPDPDAPWLAYLNMMEAHSPRIPSMSARERLLDPEMIELGLRTDASLAALNEYIVGERTYTPAELEAIAGVYDASILDLDDATGDLLDDLERRGDLDDTIVVLVADHGEALGEHQMFEHRWSVWQQLLHVPLVVYYPEELQPGRVADRVSTVDVFSTVLDLTGVAPPEGPIASRSLRTETPRRFVYAQLLDPFEEQMAGLKKAFPDKSLAPWLRTYQVVFEGAWKRIEDSDGGVSLFHVHDDPDELLDRYSDEVERADRLAQRLTEWRASLPKPPADCRADGEGPTMSDDEREMLCRLGYLDCSD